MKHLRVQQASLPRRSVQLRSMSIRFTCCNDNLDIPELVMRKTVVRICLKRPPGPRRLLTIQLSVLPSRALKLSSKSTISQRAYTARARACSLVSKSSSKCSDGAERDCLNIPRVAFAHQKGLDPDFLSWCGLHWAAPKGHRRGSIVGQLGCTSVDLPASNHRLPP